MCLVSIGKGGKPTQYQEMIIIASIPHDMKIN